VVEFLILGPLEARVDGRPQPLGGRRQRALLAVLLLAGGQAVSRDRLVEEVWGADAPTTAAHAAQVYISRLREILGSDAVLTSPGPSYSVPAATDARRFEELLAEGLLDEALALWRGPVLADLAYEGLAQTEIARLEELRLTALEERTDGELAAGRHRELVAELEALVAEHPLRERARGQLMLALYRSGRQADALEIYREGRRRMVDELGIEPGEQLRALEGAILRQDPGLRVEDPELRGRRHLPAPATSLVGRLTEVAEVTALLRSEARLVTLTGPGGTGKTRLAIQSADELRADFPDGVHFVDLSALRDPDLVGPTIAVALRTDPDALAGHLRERRLLLVLDNFEQVDAAAPLVAELIGAAPGLKALVTSRGRLRLYGEHHYPVGPLASPDDVELFRARARAIRRGFDAKPEKVAEVTARVERLPLAIELVAARVDEVSLDAMIEALGVLELAAEGPRDAPARHQTLRATIDWSYDLLDEEARTLFARLGVFAGGCDDEAALAVAGDGTARLAERSLLRRDADRWTMLETIRERALERLGDAADVRRRHGEHYVVVAEASETELKGAEQREWGERIEREHDNMRAALTWSLEHDRTLALRFAAGLGWFWYTHGHGAEGVRWLERALADPGDAPPLLRGRATHVLGILLAQRAEHAGAEKHFDAGLELFREAGDESRAAASLNSLAITARMRGDLAQCRAHFEEAIALRRKLGDRRGLATPLANLGELLIDERDFPDARARLEESVQIEREFENEWGIALGLRGLGALAIEEGDLDRAGRLLGDVIRRLRELGDRFALVETLERCAGLAGACGDARRAARLAGAAAAQREALDEPLAPPEAAILDRYLARPRAELAETAFAEAWSEGASLTLDQALDEAV
jgi:predicted ATPase/DNA-binding SARP family transcriptional activator